jgi:glyoxylase-like metal-dependent hydrolase (beta-lactamase superfamily II)
LYQSFFVVEFNFPRFTGADLNILRINKSYVCLTDMISTNVLINTNPNPPSRDINIKANPCGCKGDFTVIEQLRVGLDNFCYVIYCSLQKKAAVVDPGFDATKSLHFLAANHLLLEYVILTHYHSDHSAETKQLKMVVSSCKIVASQEDGRRLPVKPDVTISDGSQLKIGSVVLSFLLTPGHTPGGICIIVDKKALLTGDTLFIGDCGRTDLPGGSLETMFQTLQKKIMSLPDDLIVFPGHDYGEKPFDSLGNQKRTNKTLRARTLQEFSQIP